MTPIIALLPLAFGAVVSAVDIKAVESAASALDRYALFNSSDFVFDFFNNVTLASDGVSHRKAADVNSFPVLISQGVAMTVVVLGPCAQNSPHIHPRATEFQFLVNGTVKTGVFEENDGKFITQTLHGGQATVFPRGSIHFEQNLGCEPLLFVAAFSSDDPGTTQIAQAFFGELPDDTVSVTLGGVGVEVVDAIKAQLPPSLSLGADSCLKRCGLTRSGVATIPGLGSGSASKLFESGSSSSSSSAGTVNTFDIQSPATTVLPTWVLPVTIVLILFILGLASALVVVSRRQSQATRRSREFIYTIPGEQPFLVRDGTPVEIGEKFEEGRESGSPA